MSGDDGSDFWVSANDVVFYTEEQLASLKTVEDLPRTTSSLPAANGGETVVLPPPVLSPSLATPGSSSVPLSVPLPVSMGHASTQVSDLADQSALSTIERFDARQGGPLSETSTRNDPQTADADTQTEMSTFHQSSPGSPGSPQLSVWGPLDLQQCLKELAEHGWEPQRIPSPRRRASYRVTMRHAETGAILPLRVQDRNKVGRDVWDRFLATATDEDWLRDPAGSWRQRSAQVAEIEESDLDTTVVGSERSGADVGSPRPSTHNPRQRTLKSRRERNNEQRQRSITTRPSLDVVLEKLALLQASSRQEDERKEQPIACHDVILERLISGEKLVKDDEDGGSTTCPPSDGEQSLGGFDDECDSQASLDSFISDDLREEVNAIEEKTTKIELQYTTMVKEDGPEEVDGQITDDIIEIELMMDTHCPPAERTVEGVALLDSRAGAAGAGGDSLISVEEEGRRFSFLLQTTVLELVLRRNRRSLLDLQVLARFETLRGLQVFVWARFRAVFK